MKNEALIKAYLDEKDELINSLEERLKEGLGINEKGLTRIILKCYEIVYHLRLSAFIDYDENNEITKVRYSYFVTLNHFDVILSQDIVEKDLKTIAKEVVEASIKDLDKRI